MRANVCSAKLGLVLGLMLLATGFPGIPAFAQEAVALIGNHPPEAENEAPAGARALDAPLTLAVTLQLRNQAGAERLAAQMQDPASPSYHQWLTAEEFTAQFGPTQAGVDAVVNWLADAGFTIVSASREQRLVSFTGTVDQAQRAFHTTVYSFGDGSLYGNLADPQIPRGLATVIAQVHGLDNLHAAAALIPQMPRLQTASRATAGAGHPARRPRRYAALDRSQSANDSSAAASPDAIIGGLQSFGPADFATFYDATPLRSGGIDGGGGDCIAIVGDSDFEPGAINAFNVAFSQPASNITTVFVNSRDPGFNKDEQETLLDLEWAHAVAPGAALRYYTASSATPAIGAIADQINAAVAENLCGVISVSFGLCGSSRLFFTKTISSIYAQAALQGQSIVVASGDQGAAGLVFDKRSRSCVTGKGRGVNELAADPNVTAVGGASFNPSFDGSGNDLSVVSGTALRVWNDPEDGVRTGGASGGGKSPFFRKPPYQFGLGVPNDNRRDLPDLALIASPSFPGVLTYMDSDCFPRGGCDGFGAPQASIFGGTSLSAPAMAGIVKLVAEHNAVARLGSLNPKLYELANSTIHATVFTDVTAGNNSFNRVKGFAAGPGFDLATGWGSVDINGLASNYFANVITVGPSALELAPKALNFGNVKVGGRAGSRVKRLTIVNSAKFKAVAVINTLATTAGFSASPACNNAPIASGRHLLCDITFTPTGVGRVNGTLTITDNAGNSPQAIALTGKGIQ